MAKAKNKTDKPSLYIRCLSDIGEEVFEEMIVKDFKMMEEKYPT